MTKQARTIMLQGTSSDVGKSVLAAALCRIFTQDGLRTAPFKSQNMSLNAYITPDGLEIGQAQGMQADACGIPATTDMNPILLKPSADMASQVIVHGKPYKQLDARTYRESYLDTAGDIVKASLAKLRDNYEVLVIEGAGSPAEINLKDRDIVNMRLAAWADAPVLLVADIDRGGVFAAIVGTLELLTPEERARVQGFIINKFRGDVRLLQPGLDWLEQKTGKPVLGVVPFLEALGLEDEDGASLEHKLRSQSKLALAQGDHHAESATEATDTLNITVVRLPYMANVAQLEPLKHESDVSMLFAAAAADLKAARPDIVIMPESSNEAAAALYLKDSGLGRWLMDFEAEGGHIVRMDSENRGHFHNNAERRKWLNQFRLNKGWEARQESVDYAAKREAAFDRLADHVRNHVQIDRVKQIMGL